MAANVSAVPRCVCETRLAPHAMGIRQYLRSAVIALSALPLTRSRFNRKPRWSSLQERFRR
ncbi:hypothetical protein KCP69_06045 [Salmonella enterica subsp. enterica]|nr:hypothetical protein KCP69_06045 [Salmonella enterica subsp. enterica]